MIYRKQEYSQEDREDSRFQVKQIEMLEPIDSGEEESRFVGHVNLMVQTPMGNQQLPVSFEIEADDLEDAFDKFAAHANPQVEQARQQVEAEVQKLRKQSPGDSGRIVRPGDMDMKNQGNVIDFDQQK